MTFCQVIAGERVLRQRLGARGWSTTDVDRAVEEMRTLLRDDLVRAMLDTTHGSPGELAARGRRLIDPVLADAPQPSVRLAGPGGVVTVVCGPRAVGKSSVSWEMCERRTATGQRTCYLDLDQISFLRGGGASDPDRRVLRNMNLAALWRTAAERGAAALIANGMITGDDDIVSLRAAVSPADVHLIRLSAEPEAIEERIRRRHPGSPARLAGDDLEGATPARQHRVLEDANEQERLLSRTQLSDRVIDTTAMSLDRVVRWALTATETGVARSNPG